MTNVLLYSRVATSDQVFSLAYQEETMIKHCNENNYNIVKSFKEVYSGKTFNRPEWQSLKLFLKKNKGSIDKILILRSDRFCRNYLESYNELESLKKLNVVVEMVEYLNGFSEIDKALIQVVYDMLPIIENNKISNRTKEGIYRARLNGCYTSKAPLGYKNHRIGYNSTLAFNVDSKTIKQVFKLFAEGKYSISEIRNFLKEKGINKTNRDLKKILTNRVYLGEIHVPAFKEHKETYVQGLHEPLITKDVFEKANKLILFQGN